MKIHKKMILSVLFMGFWGASNAQKPNQISLTEPGKFVVGCNYWASHAGTHMWSDWKPEIVEADLRQLKEAGMQVIRVFPNWADFQPIYQFYGGNGNLAEIRFKDSALPGTGPGKNGVSTEALAHFKQFADMAQKHNIKLIVGLITGFMSGQLLVPPALEGKKLLSDPSSIMWQVKFVRTFVSEFKSHPAIIAWDLGNECSVIEDVANGETSYVWLSSISNAIKSEDSTRPVVSGMHKLSPSSKAKWRIQDQSENTDLLTSHPYPFFRPYGNQYPINSMRPIILGAAESRFYGDIGGKPCLVEETGVMGPMEANELVKKDFLRANLFNNWAYDCHGLLWWCAYDQHALNFPPYEWTHVERDLGMFRPDRTPKPFVVEFKDFKQFLDRLPFEALPLRTREAVCVLTEEQDQWAVAYSSFTLAKQAGFDIEFQYCNQPLKEASVYFLPSVKGYGIINREYWLNLLTKVKSGATLYVSFDTGFLSHFIEAAGIEVVNNQLRTDAADFISADGSIKNFRIASTRKLNMKATTAQVLAYEKDNNPIFTVNKYGKGKIYFLTVPLEMALTEKTGSFSDMSMEYWKIYQIVASEAMKENRVLWRSESVIGITEHSLNESQKVAVLVNCGDSFKEFDLKMKDGWITDKILYGKSPFNNKAQINANDALVLMLRKK